MNESYYMKNLRDGDWLGGWVGNSSSIFIGRVSLLYDNMRTMMLYTTFNPVTQGNGDSSRNVQDVIVQKTQIDCWNWTAPKKVTCYGQHPEYTTLL